MKSHRPHIDFFRAHRYISSIIIMMIVAFVLSSCTTSESIYNSWLDEFQLAISFSSDTDVFFTYLIGEDIQTGPWYAYVVFSSQQNLFDGYELIGSASKPGIEEFDWLPLGGQLTFDLMATAFEYIDPQNFLVTIFDANEVVQYQDILKLNADEAWIYAQRAEQNEIDSDEIDESDLPWGRMVTVPFDTLLEFPIIIRIENPIADPSYYFTYMITKDIDDYIDYLSN